VSRLSLPQVRPDAVRFEAIGRKNQIRAPEEGEDRLIGLQAQRIARGRSDKQGQPKDNPGTRQAAVGRGSTGGEFGCWGPTELTRDPVLFLLYQGMWVRRDQ